MTASLPQKYPEEATASIADTCADLDEISRMFEYGSETRIQIKTSAALYIRSNHERIRDAVYTESRRQEQYTHLLTNPNFLRTLSTICRQDEDEPTPNTREGWGALGAEAAFLHDVVLALGVPEAKSCIGSWEYWDNGRMPNIARNIGSMASLERARPGAVHLLSTFYGIRHFGRYPVEMLADQYDAHSGTENDYGVIISAVHDHNGAFSGGETHVPAEIYRRVKPTAHDIRVCEAGSELEFQERLDALDTRHGKIAFGAIQAHGETISLQLGQTPGLGEITVASQLEHVGQPFEPGASVALISCSTGNEGGIAQMLSRRFRISTEAPTVTIGEPRIYFSSSQGRPQILPAFLLPHPRWNASGPPAPTKRYINGNLQKHDRELTIVEA